MPMKPPKLADPLQFVCEQDELRQALETVCRVPASGGYVPIHSAVRVVAESETVRLTAADHTLAIHSSISAKSSQIGEAAILDRKKTLAAVKSLDPGEIEISVDLDTAVALIKQGPLTLRLPIGNVDDFVKPPEKLQSKVNVPTETLLDTYAFVGPSASKDESRPVLTAILLEAGKGQMTMVATDSYRLSWETRKVPVKLKLDDLVPAEALNTLSKLAAKHKAISIGFSPTSPTKGKWIGFEFGFTQLFARVLVGQFPKYRELIPDAFESKIKLPRADMIKGVDRIAKMTSGNTPARISVSTDGSVTLGLEQRDGVSISQEIASEGQVRDAFVIGLNPGFLLEGLKSLNPEDGMVTMNAISPLRPIVFDDGQDNDRGYLIMPIRLAG